MRIQTFILRSFLLLNFLFICNIFAQDEFLEYKHLLDPAKYALEDPHTVKILNSMKLSSIKEIDKEKTIEQVLELFLSSDNRRDRDFASVSAIIRYSKCKTR